MATTAYGGAGNDVTFSNDGDDVLSGGVGNDTVSVGGGDDTVLGGLGTDTMNFNNQSLGGVVARLGTGTAILAGVDTLVLKGFENADGTSFDDAISGTGTDNTLNGFGGNDTLFGGSGIDRLFGGGGDDSMFGGTSVDFMVGSAGADTMGAGAGADQFIYALVSESTTASRDVIHLFENGNDLIDLLTIDAIPGGSDDGFAFIGSAAFSGAAAQVRATKDVGAGTTLIEVRLAGSVTDDMQILLDTALTLTAASFVL